MYNLLPTFAERLIGHALDPYQAATARANCAVGGTGELVAPKPVGLLIIRAEAISDA